MNLGYVPPGDDLARRSHRRQCPPGGAGNVDRLPTPLCPLVGPQPLEL